MQGWSIKNRYYPDVFVSIQNISCARTDKSILFNNNITKKQSNTFYQDILILNHTQLPSVTNNWINATIISHSTGNHAFPLTHKPLELMHIFFFRHRIHFFSFWIKISIIRWKRIVCEKYFCWDHNILLHHTHTRAYIYTPVWLSFSKKV